MPDPDLEMGEGGGGASSRPWDEGGGAVGPSGLILV